jgi:hypothetical protein
VVMRDENVDMDEKRVASIALALYANGIRNRLFGNRGNRYSIVRLIKVTRLSVWPEGTPCALAI